MHPDYKRSSVAVQAIEQGETTRSSLAAVAPLPLIQIVHQGIGLQLAAGAPIAPRTTTPQLVAGIPNTASGTGSAIPGGQNNEAAGSYAFAAGNNAHATHPGSFVWSDGWGINLSSSANDEFSARASGGYRLYSNTGHTSGVTLGAGANAWVGVSDSTKNRDIRQPVPNRSLIKLCRSLLRIRIQIRT